ncbi:MAG: repeat containing protein [Clostridia bacterium]|nr:repeat containing protein [Clostridia bacterium]
MIQNNDIPASGSNQNRKTNPNDINIPKGYKIDVMSDGLTTPINITYSDKNELLIADSGVADGNGKVLKLVNGKTELIAEGFRPPLTGITSHKNGIYVAHRGAVTLVKSDGSKQDIISDLPSRGDHHNNRVVFGSDGKMYFGQGTATNSGVVGEDNMGWVRNYPDFHDYPGASVVLSGVNYETDNFLTPATDSALTGAYAPFNVRSQPNEVINGAVKASGSILKANPDGSGLELVAWGLRNPFRIRFDKWNRLFAANHGMDVRGSRPVANSPDEFQMIKQGGWYGWPDFTGGLPVTLERFKPEGMAQPQFLLKRHFAISRPIAIFEPHSAIMGFDFNYSYMFGKIGDIYIAEFGSEAPETTGGIPLPDVGHRVTRIDKNSGMLYDFAINKSGYAASYTGDGGFERPIDVIINTENEMLIADFGLGDESEGFIPNSGVIWRISKK